VVETTTDFVPNDVRLDEGTFLIVTGPNMSGKSTYIRQTALIILLAQIGSFVPAREATVGLVDGIFTRVGALDELAGGRSTFMVEMEELSKILHAATENSLVILDEVGRGTATFDGISIAWAATEYLHNEIRARTLFATHYHELTTMADHLDRVSNCHVAAVERDGEVTFLRTVEDGATDRSYGIHVAELAGVPDPVVERSRDVLDRLRREKAIEARGSSGTTTQQVVFDVRSGEMKPASAADGGNDRDDTAGTDDSGDPDDPADRSGEGDAGKQIDPETRSILEEIRDTDVNETPPIELMAMVQDWQRSLTDPTDE
jgi:DNA mismatch repair protein MutS